MLALVLEVNTYFALFPLFEVAHDATPLRRLVLRKGALIVGRVVWFEAEDLDACARVLVHNHTRAHYARIVKYEHRTLRQILSYVAKMALLDSPVIVYE